MSRAQLLAQLTTSISTMTQYGVSQELPWSQNGQPLFRKNMKKLYLDNEQIEQTTMFPVMNGSDVYMNLWRYRVYLAVDAKNPPSQLQTLITKVLELRDTSYVTAADRESDYTVEIDEDVEVYTFEVRLGIVT